MKININWPRFIKMSLAVAAFLWLFWLCMAAGAATLRGNKESCSGLGDVVIQAGEVRDSGVPWEVFKARLDDSLTEAKANPASFVQSEEDAKFITKALKLLWNNPQEVPLVIAAAVYKSCMELPT